jgi:poly(3-hydroxybutyrate) depolymerase
VTLTLEARDDVPLGWRVGAANSTARPFSVAAVALRFSTGVELRSLRLERGLGLPRVLPPGEEWTASFDSREVARALSRVRAAPTCKATGVVTDGRGREHSSDSERIHLAEWAGPDHYWPSAATRPRSRDDTRPVP